MVWRLYWYRIRKWKLYQAKVSTVSTHFMMKNHLNWNNQPSVKLSKTVLKTPPSINFAELCERTLLQFYASASVITNLKGNIFYVHGETHRYLCPALSQASLNVIDMT